MPRKPPTEIIEHRISLSNFERKAILEQIEKNRQNGVLTAGINQVGAIAGSGILLYGLLAYFGYSLFGEAKNAITDFIDNTSTKLADTWGEALGVPLNTAEATAIRNAYDRLDDAIRYEREELRINTVAGTALINQLRSGDISYDEFKNSMYDVTQRSHQLEVLTNDIVFAKRQVDWVKSQANQGADVPSWLAESDWRTLIVLAYDNQYSPMGEPVERPDVFY